MIWHGVVNWKFGVYDGFPNMKTMGMPPVVEDTFEAAVKEAKRRKFDNPVHITIPVYDTQPVTQEKKE